jgi:hypothetical protein
MGFFRWWRQGLLWMLAISLFSASASAQRVDPNYPTRMVIGRSPGHFPMDRGNPGRTGRVSKLPTMPKQLWHQQVRGGLSLPMVTAENGTIIVASTAAMLVQFSAGGQEQWQRRLGLSFASTGPVVLSDGTRMVLTATAQAWGYAASGRLRFRADLGDFGMDPRTSPLPLDNGSVVVAVGSHLITLDPRGEILVKADLGQRIVGNLVGLADGVVATTETGDVYRWTSPLPPRRLGTFRGNVREGIALMGPHTLISAVDMQRLTTMDLRTGTTIPLLNHIKLDGPPSVSKKGWAYIATDDGILLTVSSAGEQRRIRLDPVLDVPLDPDGQALSSYTLSSHPALLVDESDRIVFVRENGKVGVVSARGDVNFAAESCCKDAFSLAAVSEDTFVVGCRSGGLYVYGPG